MDMSPLTWTFIDECPTPKHAQELLLPGEMPLGSYRTFRDTATFTNKRLIIRDTQGLTGKKVETYSIPYGSINAWSTENAGHLDFDAEVTLLTRAGIIKINLKRAVDVTVLERILAEAVLMHK